MSTISLRLSDSMHMTASALAKRDDVSLNQFIALAVAEKVSALGTEDILRARALRGDYAKFLAVLDKAPDVEDERDSALRLPTVEELIAMQFPSVQVFTRRLMNLIIATDVESFVTNATPGGDLRFRVPNGNFAEITFNKTKEHIDLRLYFAPDFNPGSEFKKLPSTSKQSKFVIRLNVSEPVSLELQSLIERSREFMRNKRS